MDAATIQPLSDDTTETPEASEPQELIERELLEDELLVEEVSIDGMCGVY